VQVFNLWRVVATPEVADIGDPDIDLRVSAVVSFLFAVVRIIKCSDIGM
jgi:hypothetical protein